MDGRGWDGAGEPVRNDLSGFVSGQVVQARLVDQVHFHSKRTYEQVVPSQLPMAAGPFVAREAELDRLRRMRLDQSDRPLLVVLTGAAGMGKSRLATRWLHETSGEFRDGQLYLNLTDESRSAPVVPTDALECFLASFGVPAKKIPADEAQRAALFRSITAERHVAVMLDDAVSAAQVRPLLPAGSQNLVVVTSRSRLSGLAMEGARLIDVGPLDEAGSLALVEARVGPDRVSAELDAARVLVGLCGGVPLALSVVGARLSARERRSLGREVVAIAGEQQRLAGLALSDEVSVKAALDVSCDALDEQARQLYRSCAGHPGREFGVFAAAAASGWDAATTTAALDDLVEANLLAEVDDSRFGYHDLVRVHARHRAENDDGQDAYVESIHRTASWYLARTVAADLVVHPLRPRLGPLYQPGNQPEAVFTDERDALAWLEMERDNLRSVVDTAAQRHWHDLVWQVCEALWGLFLHTRRYGDWIAMQKIGIVSAAGCGDRRAEARLRSQLGFAYAKTRRFDAAVDENTRALRLAEADGDDQGRATALSQLGRAARGTGDLAGALRYFGQARDLQHQLGQRRGVALCRRRIGDILAQLGELDEAMIELRAAAHTMAELGDHTQYARTLLVLGETQQRAGRTDLATDSLNEALAAMRAMGSPYYQGEILAALGAVAEQEGDIESAVQRYTEAGELYDTVEDPQAQVMRTRLTTLGERTT